MNSNDLNKGKQNSFEPGTSEIMKIAEEVGADFLTPDVASIFAKVINENGHQDDEESLPDTSIKDTSYNKNDLD